MTLLPHQPGDLPLRIAQDLYIQGLTSNVGIVADAVQRVLEKLLPERPDDRKLLRVEIDRLLKIIVQYSDTFGRVIQQKDEALKKCADFLDEAWKHLLMRSDTDPKLLKELEAVADGVRAAIRIAGSN